VRSISVSVMPFSLILILFINSATVRPSDGCVSATVRQNDRATDTLVRQCGRAAVLQCDSAASVTNTPKICDFLGTSLWKRSLSYSSLWKRGARGDLKMEYPFFLYKISPNPSLPKRGNSRTVALTLPSHSRTAEVIDRVIACVDDRAITLREFDDIYEKTRKIRPDITREEVLNTFINRILLIREAKKLKIEAPSEDELMNEYIELKVKAFIRIKEEDIRNFYSSHPGEFKDMNYDSVRDRIEDYLVQLELNRLLKRHIDELRSNAYIKILD